MNENLLKKIWNVRYIICLKEDLTVREIAIITGKSVTFALIIRKEAIKLLVDRNPNYIPPKTKIPTEAVFEVIGHDLNYFYNKMVAERKAFA